MNDSHWAWVKNHYRCTRFSHEHPELRIGRGKGVRRFHFPNAPNWSMVIPKDRKFTFTMPSNYIPGKKAETSVSLGGKCDFALVRRGTADRLAEAGLARDPGGNGDGLLRGAGAAGRRSLGRSPG